MEKQVEIRPAQITDSETCGEMVFGSFKNISEKHGLPSDFPSREMTINFIKFLIEHKFIYGVVAEGKGQILGLNFMDERNVIRAVGPIVVDLPYRGLGIGKKLMEAVISRAQESPGIRLIQEAFNMEAISLYTKLGFRFRESLVLMGGKIGTFNENREIEIRPLNKGDLKFCAKLAQKVIGYERKRELQDSIKLLSPYVLLKKGQIKAYSSATNYWMGNHGVGETEEDLKDLIQGMGPLVEKPLYFLLPLKNTSLFHWCLRKGFHVVKSLFLFSMGDYQEPNGGYYPSVCG